MNVQFIILVCLLMVCDASEAIDRNNCCLLSKKENLTLHFCKASISKQDLSNDSCVNILMDTVVYRYIRTKNIEYLKILNYFIQIADGVIAEMLNDKVAIVISKQSAVFIKQLYSVSDSDPLLEEIKLNTKCYDSQNCVNKDLVTKNIDLQIKNCEDIPQRKFYIRLRRLINSQ